MEYVVHRRFKSKAICGEVNMPAMTKCTVNEGVIYYEEYPICNVKCENSHQYFAPNYDGNGMLRGKLTQAIQKKLAKRDEEHQARWDKIWEDHVSQKYKRTDHADYWLWNHEFFGAPIIDLEHIAGLIGAKVE